MNGEIQSGRKTIDDRRKEIDDAITTFTDSLGIPRKFANVDIAKEYMSVTRDELNTLSREECLNRAFILSQHSFNIQLQYNTESARVKWANTLLGKIASNVDYANGKWVNFEEKKLKAAINDDAAGRLLDIKNYAEARMTHLEFLASSLNNMINTLKELAKVKGEKNG